MSQELTERILNSLKGYLDITVVHPSYAGKLIVKGATVCALDYSWENMPSEMKVDRAVYCCRPAWDERFPAIFVFADEVKIVDAPAYLVVGRMLDMLHEMGADGAVDRLENPDDVWHGEDEEDTNGDWNDTSAELR
jgi:hypothetical protein